MNKLFVTVMIVVGLWYGATVLAGDSAYDAVKAANDIGSIEARMARVMGN